MKALSGILLFSILTAPLLAQNKPITIGPTVISFPELARKLSVDGRTVVCASGLRESAAVISLKKRSWTETQELLGSGLDIRFSIKPESPNTWFMERDPAITEKDARLLHGLALLAKQKIGLEIGPYVKHLDEPIHLRLQRMLALQHELAQREKQNPKRSDEATKQMREELAEYSEDSDPFTAVAARIGYRFSGAAYDSAMRPPLAFQRVDIHRIADVKMISLIMIGELSREERDAPIPDENGEVIVGDDFGADVFKQILKDVAAGDIAVFNRLHFDPAALRMTLQQMYVLAGKYSFREGVTVQLLDDNGYEGVLTHIGDEGRKQFESDHYKTKEWAKTAPAKRIFDLPTGLQVTSLSQAIEGWAKDGSEVIMELAEYREELNGMEVSSDRTSDTQPLKSISLAQIVNSERLAIPWSFTEHKGVLLVRNPMSFLDHLQPIPLAALLRLEAEVTPKTGGPRVGWDLRLSEIVGFQQSVSPAHNAALGLSGGLYRGVPIRVLSEARFATILRRLTPRQLEVLELQLEAKGEAWVPMSMFAPRDLLELTASLRAQALSQETDDGFDLIFTPEFDRVLATSTLKLTRSDRELLITLVRPIKEKGEPDNITSVAIAAGLRP